VYLLIRYKTVYLNFVLIKLANQKDSNYLWISVGYIFKCFEIKVRFDLQLKKDRAANYTEYISLTLVRFEIVF
jgi:hypothetical protein